MRLAVSSITRALMGFLASVGAILIALILGAIIINLSGGDTAEAYQRMWNAAFSGRRAIAETLISTAPLILGGLAFAVAAKAGMFNIGIEGQLVVGGFAAGLVGAWNWDLPRVIYLPLALLAAAAAGGIWGFIPGYLKAKTGAHEVITTIMLNYLAFRLIRYLILRKDDGLPVDPNLLATKKVAENSKLPIILDGTRLHAGIIVAVVCAILLWYFLGYTRFGYTIRTVGLSRGASAYGGINWGMTVVIAMTLAGVLSGLAGAGEAIGLNGRHFEAPPGYGFTAIAVGLVGRNNPLAIIPAGLLFGALNAGAPAMQRADVSKEIVLVIQGLVILAVAALDVFNRLPGLRKRLAAFRLSPTGAWNE